MTKSKTTPTTEVDRVVIWPKVSSAKLHRENRCGVYPLTSLGGGEYEVDDGWVVSGWSIAPWKGTSEWAIVFEKTSPARETFDPMDSFEPGLYWCHGDITAFKFRSI